MMKRAFIVFFLLFLFSIPSSFSEPVRVNHVEAQLISETTSIQPGKSVWVALHLKMDKEWHVYWRNPGDSGLAPKITWQLPSGFEAGDIQWPFPEKIEVPPLVTYGYENEVFLLSEIKIPRTLSLEAPAKIKAKAAWLVCKEVCIPGQAELSISLPVKNEPALADIKWAKAFAQTRFSWPLSAQSSGWEIVAKNTKGNLVFDFKNSSESSISDVFFFPYNENIVNYSAKQSFQKTSTGYSLSVPKQENAEAISKISGILVSKEGWLGKDSQRAIEVKDLQTQTGASTTGSLSVITALWFAFVGGLILNLMPCVFPVLGLKVLGLVKQSGDDKKARFASAGIFTFGVLTTFWVLVAVLIVFRASGLSVGWGFQLQSPWFVLALVNLFFLIALNLVGVFEVTLNLPGVGVSQTKTQTHDWKEHFSSGVLTTLVATPCTAPFMGAALGFAISQSAILSFLIFTFLGLGVATPYAFFSFFPGLLKFLPKPGMWMVRVKQVLGVSMGLTVIWLIWILTLQLDGDFLIEILAGLMIVGLAAFLWGSPAAASDSKNSAKLRTVSLILFLIGMAISVLGVKTAQKVPEASELIENELDWERFSSEKVNKLRKENRAVFLDFTAAWCLTCQVNDRIALQNPRVQNAFKAKNVALVKADWTSYDPKITEALASYGRNSIPFYALYLPGSNEPITLPELITPEIVLRELEKIK